MAITPNEAKERAASDKRELRTLETRIDSMIVAHLRAKTPLTFDATILGDPLQREAIRDRYTSAGWNVLFTFHHDYREPDYVTFEPKRESSYCDPHDTPIPAGDLYADR